MIRSVVTATCLLVLVVAAPNLARASDAIVSGTWVGAIAVNGVPHAMALQLEQRGDGRLLGYVLGGAGAWTLISGSTDGKVIDFTLEVRTLEKVMQYRITGGVKVKKNKAEGEIGGRLADGSGALFHLVKDTLRERRFLVASLDASGEPASAVDVAVVVSPSGALMAGTFVGVNDCALDGCEGAVTAFSDTSTFSPLDGETTFGFRSGGCTATIALRPYLPVEKIYSGEYVCAGVSTPTYGGRTTQTTTTDVEQILARMGDLADQIEAGTPLVEPHAAFSPDYLDAGWRLDDLLNAYDVEMVRYGSRVATFNRFSRIHTMPDPDQITLESFTIGAAFEEQRSGIPAGSVSRVTYVDSFARRDPFAFRLGLWGNEGGHWVVRGNQIPPLDFPFKYSIVTDPTTGAPRVEIPTDADASRVYPDFGPFGAHFPPWTGHQFGDAKGNVAGFFTRSDADLDPVNHGYYGGPGGSLLLQRRPLYIAPATGVVATVECRAAGSIYLPSEPYHWTLGLLVNDERYFVLLDHLSALHDSLRERILAATGISTDTCPSSGGGNILGAATIPITLGDPLAFPQVVAHELPTAPGYFVGGGGVADRPWAQMEFSVAVGGDSARCYYDVMPQSVRPTLQATMNADVADPASQRLRAFPGIKWAWGAEARLCTTPSSRPDDFSDLYTSLGGWFEQDGPGAIVSNEIVAFAPIAKDVPTYVAARYSSPAVDMLVLRRTAFSTAMLGPTGELIERTADTLLILWRVPPFPAGFVGPYYQRATYALSADGLKINWGGVPSATAEGAVAPVPVDALTCNGTTVVCYDHIQRGAGVAF